MKLFRASRCLRGVGQKSVQRPNPTRKLRDRMEIPVGLMFRNNENFSGRYGSSLAAGPCAASVKLTAFLLPSVQTHDATTRQLHCTSFVHTHVAPSHPSSACGCSCTREREQLSPSMARVLPELP
jgi:hypothetical protein